MIFLRPEKCLQEQNESLEEGMYREGLVFVHDYGLDCTDHTDVLCVRRMLC